MIQITDDSDPDYRHILIPKDLDEKLCHASSDQQPSSTPTIRDLIRAVDVIYLHDRSKGDGISKGLALLQSVWFVASIISRAASGLAVTELEISTLALAFVSCSLYLFWWDKPQGVLSQILLDPELKLHDSMPRHGTDLDRVTQAFLAFFMFFKGRKDWKQHTRVPTMWWGPLQVDHGDHLRQMLLLSLIGVVFGAVHCIAWAFFFPSSAEKILWRTSAIIVAFGLPIFTIVSLILAVDFDPSRAVIVMFVIYLLARLNLLVLSLIALRDMPYSAYQTVPWLSYIPHL